MIKPKIWGEGTGPEGRRHIGIKGGKGNKELKKIKMKKEVTMKRHHEEIKILV